MELDRTGALRQTSLRHYCGVQLTSMANDLPIDDESRTTTGMPWSLTVSLAHQPHAKSISSLLGVQHSVSPVSLDRLSIPAIGQPAATDHGREHARLGWQGGVDLGKDFIGGALVDTGTRCRSRSDGAEYSSAFEHCKIILRSRHIRRYCME